MKKHIGKQAGSHRKNRRACFAGLLVLFVLLLFLPSMRIHAAEEGLWYIEEFHLDAIHEEGITGKGIKIADIDTLINPDLPWLADADLVLQEKAITKYYGDVSPASNDFDIAVHATDMVGLLAGNGEGAAMGRAQIGIAPDVTIYHYAAVHDVDDDALTGGDIFDEAMKYALEDGVDIISIPAGGLSYYDKQYPYFLEAIRKGIPVLVAHKNERYRIDQDTRPEVYDDGQGGELLFEELPTASWTDEISYWPGLVTVQALDSQFRVQVYSRSEDSGTDICAPGEDIWMHSEDWGYFEPLGGGCSAATTSAAGFLALAMQKWPDATGNQILQLMARTPEWQSTEAYTNPDYDILNLEISPFYGWGAIDVSYMLETDPTIFPDVNPVLYKDVAKIVKNAELRGDTQMLQEKELIEVAQVLDEQLEKEKIERPSFLKKVLGEERGASQASGGVREGNDNDPDAGTEGTEGTEGAEGAERPGEGENDTASNDVNTGTTSQGNTPGGAVTNQPGKPGESRPVSDLTGARNGGSSALLGFLAVVGIVGCLLAGMFRKRADGQEKQKKPKKPKDSEEEFDDE